MTGNAAPNVTWQGSARSAVGANGFVAYIKLHATSPAKAHTGHGDLLSEAANDSGRSAVLWTSSSFADRRARPARLQRRT